MSYPQQVVLVSPDPSLSLAVLHADSRDAAKRKLREFARLFGKQFPEAVACLERGRSGVRRVGRGSGETNTTICG